LDKTASDLPYLKNGFDQGSAMGVLEEIKGVNESQGVKWGLLRKSLLLALF